MRVVQIAILAGALTVACASSTPPPPSSIVAPVVVHRVEPAQPPELRQQHVTGTVMIAGTVPKEGGVLREPHVVRSDDPRLSQLALDAVSQWVWKPGLLDGKPVDVVFTTQVSFSAHD